MAKVMVKPMIKVMVKLNGQTKGQLLWTYPWVTWDNILKDFLYAIII